MPEPIGHHWPQIRQVLERGQRSILHCAIATVSPDGTPHVTPMGTVCLHDDGTGFFFDTYTSTLARNLATNPAVCVMAVNSGPFHWWPSFLRGRFFHPPGVRLHGTAGDLRPATPAELERIEQRLRPVRWMRGSRLLWSSFTHVRELHFTGFSPVVYPRMMEGMWG